MISVTIKPDNTGIVIGQGYGEHFVEVPTAETIETTEKIIQAYLELRKLVK
ncbi:MAG: hypothetical protein Q8O19_03455 [Rectinemataceae bacterium]|nr:hypothetical protein [Rectinemataceae bacterium]